MLIFHMLGWIFSIIVGVSLFLVKPLGAYLESHTFLYFLWLGIVSAISGALFTKFMVWVNDDQN